MPESNEVNVLRREFMEGKQFRIFGLPYETPGGLLTLRRGKETSYEAIDITARSKAEQKVHSMSEVQSLYPNAIVYLYGPTGVIRLEPKKGHVRVDILGRRQEKGEIIAVDGFLWGKDVKFKLGEALRVGYSLTTVRQEAIRDQIVLGSEPEMQVLQDSFGIGHLQGIVVQHNTVLSEDKELSADILKKLPPHEKFYKPLGVK